MTNWTKHYISLVDSNNVPDYPTLGVDANGIYLSVIEFGSSNGVSVIADNLVIAIKKPEIYQTNTIVGIISTTNVPASDLYGVIQPAVNFDASPRGGYAWFVAKQQRTNASPYLGGAVVFRRMQWSGTTASWADPNWFTVTNTSYRDYFDLDEGGVTAPHSNFTHRIDLQKMGSRLMMAVIRDGALWTCHHVGLSGTNGTFTTNQVVDRSAAQWLKLSTDTNGTFLSIANGRAYDASTVDPHYYYFPSLMVNKVGDMVMGFSGSRSNEFIGAFFSYRAADGGTPGLPFLLHPGKGSFQASSRWGDYSYTSLDPTDGIRFWTVQQYAEDDPSNNPWGTWISEILPKASTP